MVKRARFAALLTAGSLFLTSCRLAPGGNVPPSPEMTPTPGSVSTPAGPGATQVPAGPGNTGPFGVMLGGQRNNVQRVINIATDLGVTYYRPLSAFLDTGGECDECGPASGAGLTLVLTIRNNGGPRQPTTPPTDLNQFKQQLQPILQRLKPTIVVIENEMNSQLFYTGTPDQYLAELKAGCEVAHSLGMKCADGGLVSLEVAALLAKSYMDSGQADKAVSFAQRAFGDTAAQVKNADNLRRILTQQASKVAQGEQLLAGFKSAGADYVNFHWYVGDEQALREIVAFLRQAGGGLPVITNEIGQQNNDDPNQTLRELRTAKELGLPVIIWFGLDGPKARGLINPNGTLRPTGDAFRNFVRGNQ